MRSIVFVLVSACALAACRGADERLPRQSSPSGVVTAVTPAPLAPLAPVEPQPTPQPESCAARLLREHGIDVAPAPSICEPLGAAIGFLGPLARAEVKDLVIVRGERGPCADFCPDLATALMSDAALAFYRIEAHELHVLDAMFDGPRWRSPAPSEEALTAYLEALGLTWEALVARVREVTGAELPADLARGDARVFEAIVAHGPRILLGRDVGHESILLHELGHAVHFRAPGDAARTTRWSTLSAWREASPDGPEVPADGYVGGQLAGERPIVASRLALGLPRGDDALFRPGRPVFATGYAAFDPREDYAETLRLLRDDPTRLGQVAPAKLLYMVAEVARGRTPEEIAALLGPHRPHVASGLAALAELPEARAFIEEVLGPALGAP